MITYHRLEVAAGRIGGVVENIVINIINLLSPKEIFQFWQKWRSYLSKYEMLDIWDLVSKLIRQWQGRQEVLPTWYLIFDLQSKGLEFIGREVKPLSYGSREDENLSSVMVSDHMFKAGLLFLFSSSTPLKYNSYPNFYNEIIIYSYMSYWRVKIWIFFPA